LILGTLTSVMDQWLDPLVGVTTNYCICCNYCISS
jgi:hypothetical protein